ncbi:MAG TPA: hypothetical protein VMQ81_12815 [Acidimicrobiia bacterium]|nr:hypothetical protein [Acidimicrobiia bacterium]
MIDRFDVELEEMIVVVDHVLGRAAYLLDSVEGLMGPTSHDELVVAPTGQAMKDTTGLAAQVLPLRRPTPHRHEHPVGSQHRDHRVDAWAEVGAHGRQVRHAVSFPQRSTAACHLGRCGGELRPGGHAQP